MELAPTNTPTDWLERWDQQVSALGKLIGEREKDGVPFGAVWSLFWALLRRVNSVRVITVLATLSPVVAGWLLHAYVWPSAPTAPAAQLDMQRGAAVAGLGAKRHKPRKPTIEIVSAFAQVSDTAGTSTWHRALANEFDSQCEKRSTSEPSDCLVAEITASPFGAPTESFNLRIDLKKAFGFSGEAFLVHAHGGRTSYEQITLDSSSTNPVNVAVPEAETGDSLLLIGSLFTDGKGELPEDLNKCFDQVQVQ